jgi:hypothetical protein
MAHDPLSHVASWISTPAVPEVAVPAVDPVIAMIAEEKRVRSSAADVRGQAEEIEFAFPKEVRDGPRIEAGYARMGKVKPTKEFIKSEEELDRFPALVPRRRRRGHRMSSGQ